MSKSEQKMWQSMPRYERERERERDRERVIWKCYIASDFENGGRRSQAKEQGVYIACL